jgi:hypothetical protein
MRNREREEQNYTQVRERERERERESKHAQEREREREGDSTPRKLGSRASRPAIVAPHEWPISTCLLEYPNSLACAANLCRLRL